MRGGTTSQPRRQPVIRKLFEKLCATTSRSSASAMSRKLGAALGTEPDALVHLVGDDPGAGAPAVGEDRLLLGACQRPAGRVVRRVDEQHAGAVGDGCASASRSSFHAPASAVSANKRRSAPRIAGCAGRFGQTGSTTTTSSPAPTSACIAIISAFTPDDVTATRSAATARCRRDVVGDRAAQLRQPEIVRIEGLAADERIDRRVADELGRGLVALAEPEREDVGAADAGVGDFANPRPRKLFYGCAHGSAPTWAPS